MLDVHKWITDVRDGRTITTVYLLDGTRVVLTDEQAEQFHAILSRIRAARAAFADAQDARLAFAETLR